MHTWKGFEMIENPGEDEYNVGDVFSRVGCGDLWVVCQEQDPPGFGNVHGVCFQGIPGQNWPKVGLVEMFRPDRCTLEWRRTNPQKPERVHVGVDVPPGAFGGPFQELADHFQGVPYRKDKTAERFLQFMNPDLGEPFEPGPVAHLLPRRTRTWEGSVRWAFRPSEYARYLRRLAELARLRAFDLRVDYVDFVNVRFLRKADRLERFAAACLEKARKIRPEGVK